MGFDENAGVYISVVATRFKSFKVLATQENKVVSEM